MPKVQFQVYLEKVYKNHRKRIASTFTLRTWTFFCCCMVNNWIGLETSVSLDMCGRVCRFQCITLNRSDREEMVISNTQTNLEIYDINNKTSMF